jgi:hypothetical protein
MVDGALRLRWADRLEVYTIPALGHGTPIASQDLGQPAPFILEAGISSTRRIAEFWGLVPAVLARTAPITPRRWPVPVHALPEQLALPQIEAARLLPPEPTDVRAESLILRALKAVGLIRRR